ncbi:hypothetical protein O988_07995 [Pseudogymnoascus sp. VKM F-3808]|nr:hypothetical protein O988_07995 [Pseudogymnoascus sp. VKM F-3808]KFY47722.1 hypothetical protein V495_01845 [Pseudogymnoascus sp. VKM F-4514 (FW-929)]KFY65601.1 hypothetical protein V497_01347 [Pseudogymnoascus sp. VKM F-4516 (FW-969)]
MAERRLISSGFAFEDTIGYSRAVVTGSWIIVSGTTGYDHATGKISPDIVEQTEQIFRTIDKALREADATMSDVVRVRYILPDAKQFPLCWPVTRKWLGEVKPAATMIQAGLMDEEMKIEIEVTARRGDSAQD